MAQEIPFFFGSMPPVLVSSEKSSDLSEPTAGESSSSNQEIVAGQFDKLSLDPKADRIPCTLSANHFYVRFPWEDIFQYNVSITLLEDQVSLLENDPSKNRVIDKFFRKHNVSEFTFNGCNFLYTKGCLNPHLLQTTFTIPYKNQDFNVIIRLAPDVDQDNLREILKGKRADTNSQNVLNVFGKLLTKQVKISNIRVSGGSFYDPSTLMPINEVLEWCPAFRQTLRPTKVGVSLILDVSTKVFFKNQSVTDFVGHILNKDVTKSTLSVAEQFRIEELLKGVRVQILNCGDKEYIISGLKETRQSDVGRILKDYGDTITNKWLPFIKIGKDGISKPMEVCSIVGRQQFSGPLDEELTTKYCRRNPQKRKSDILETLQSNAYVSDFGMQINEALAQVEACILREPLLKFKEDVCRPVGGQWSMLKEKVVHKFVRPENVKRWTCINFSPDVNRENIKAFTEDLRRVCNSLGMSFQKEPFQRIDEFARGDAKAVLKNKLSGKVIDLVIVILPNAKRKLYANVKKTSETEIGIITQCCLTDTVMERREEVLLFLALKINAKLGGCNTELLGATEHPHPVLGHEMAIIFGADVTHPRAGVAKMPSIAAVVASMDWPTMANYACSVRTQDHGKEIITDLVDMISDLLSSFQMENDLNLPKKIIFYRDGVSETMFNQVRNEEIEKIREACNLFGENYKPSITFIVVQKRHHTRLFPINGSGNILPGTVVDQTITHPSVSNSFYLCSHGCTTEGTSRPALYHVLSDGNNFTNEQLQSLTYKLCYTFQKCTSSTSIVPAVQYAHLAAYRARMYLDEPKPGAADEMTLPPVKVNIRRKMFYL